MNQTREQLKSTTDLFIENNGRIFGSKGLVDFRHLLYIDRFIALLAPHKTL
jgi:hypothetical protein